MTGSPPRAWLDVEPHAGRAFLERGIEGEVLMLNLLRFRAVADYSSCPSLEPAWPTSGAEAYRRYIEHTLPHLHASGGDITLLGEGGPFLIGPPDDRWDLVIVVRHRSVESFMSVASNEAYLAGVGHRAAAIEDSRLLPISPVQLGSLPPAGERDPLHDPRGEPR